MTSDSTMFRTAFYSNASMSCRTFSNVRRHRQSLFHGVHLYQIRGPQRHNCTQQMCRGKLTGQRKQSRPCKRMAVERSPHAEAPSTPGATVIALASFLRINPPEVCWSIVDIQTLLMCKLLLIGAGNKARPLRPAANGDQCVGIQAILVSSVRVLCGHCCSSSILQ